MSNDIFVFKPNDMVTCPRCGARTARIDGNTEECLDCGYTFIAEIETECIDCGRDADDGVCDICGSPLCAECGCLHDDGHICAECYNIHVLGENTHCR